MIRYLRSSVILVNTIIDFVSQHKIRSDRIVFLRWKDNGGKFLWLKYPYRRKVKAWLPGLEITVERGKWRMTWTYSWSFHGLYFSSGNIFTFITTFKILFSKICRRRKQWSDLIETDLVLIEMIDQIDEHFLDLIYDRGNDRSDQRYALKNTYRSILYIKIWIKFIKRSITRHLASRKVAWIPSLIAVGKAGRRSLAREETRRGLLCGGEQSNRGFILK